MKIKMLEDLINSLISAEKASVKPQFRDQIQDLSDIGLPEEILQDFEMAEKVVLENDALECDSLGRIFVAKSDHFKEDWWDADLEQWRAGYEWESNLYRKLADIMFAE